MAEFKPIETQEQLDALIGERIARAKESARKEFEGFVSPSDLAKKTEELNARVNTLTASLNEVNGKLENSKTAIAEKDSKIKAYETASVKTKIANEYGLSFDAVDFLKGETEEDIKKSAEALCALFGKVKTPPLKSNEPPAGNSSDAAFRQALQGLNLKGV